MEENIPTMINDETGELNPSGRQALKELVNKYQDIKSINKIAEIQSGVDSLKVDMKKKIMKKMKKWKKWKKLIKIKIFGQFLEIDY